MKIIISSEMSFRITSTDRDFQYNFFFPNLLDSDATPLLSKHIFLDQVLLEMNQNNSSGASDHTNFYAGLGLDHENSTLPSFRDFFCPLRRTN